MNNKLSKYGQGGDRVFAINRTVFGVCECMVWIKNEAERLKMSNLKYL